MSSSSAARVVRPEVDRILRASEIQRSFHDRVLDERLAWATTERHAGPRAAEIQLFVEEGIPACDAGGTPLLGSYVAPGGTPEAPVGLAELAVHYRSFVTIWTEDGPYDWEAELDETIAHELEHHEGWRVGHDPMDEEEQPEVAAEHARTAGHETVARA
jgi:hypothetical protein